MILLQKEAMNLKGREMGTWEKLREERGGEHDVIS